MIRTNNPVLNERIFAPSTAYERFAESSRTHMTLNGAVTATAILLGLCAAAGVAVWAFAATIPVVVLPAMLGGLLVSFILVMVAMFKPTTAPFVAVPIALAEGAFAGGASVVWSNYAVAAKGGVVASLGPGLVIQALLLTVAIAGSLLFAYATRIIKPTENLKLGIFAATAGIGIVAILSMVLSLFGVQIPYIWGNGIIGIAFAGFIVVVAALNLVLDFDFIEQGAEQRLPKHMEWLGAIGLLVTLVWLYVSILRLLALLQSRD